ncbi:MAG: formate dehydrogenase subunit gamma [Hyphomicrobiaceae bacterium]
MARRWMFGIATGFVALLGMNVASSDVSAQAVRPPSNAVTNAAPGGSGPNAPSAPGTEKGSNVDVELWGKVRKGVEGKVSIPDTKSGVLVQSGGEAWRNFRNGPLPTWGGWALTGIVGLLAAFFAIRGRIKIEHGMSGRTLVRFNDLERMSHWLMAMSFIVLAVSGLNVLYGRYVLLPIIGKGAFAALSIFLKWLHNHVAFAFMIGLALSFVLWLKHNFPTKEDLVWLAQGGGMFSKHSHPPARKFNAGQKILFWMIMLGGLSISMSGWSLMFPFESHMFAKTFGLLNVFGLSLPTSATAIQEMQFATAWHGIVGLFLICVIIGHIYIGTVGMEGAFDAMGSGEVDENWAKEHHSIWAQEEIEQRDGLRDARGARNGRVQPAE